MVRELRVRVQNFIIFSSSGPTELRALLDPDPAPKNRGHAALQLLEHRVMVVGR